MTIELTPDQLAQLQSARATLPRLTLNEHQRQKMRDALAVETEGAQANSSKLGKLLRAEQEPGFSGSLRRAISRSQLPITELAGAAEVDPLQLEAFRTGDATLASDVVDRLVHALHLRLVAEPA